MRVDACVCAIVAAAALALPLSGVAQKFQNPTKEELQMTSDPKAPAFFFSTGGIPGFANEERRESPLDLRFSEQVIDDVVYHLPANYAVQSAPQPAQLPWPGHAALVVKTAQSPGAINVKHIFARAFVLLEPKDYPALRDYYQKIAANDQQHIVLAPGSGAAGN